MHVQKIVKKNRTCNKALNDLQIVKKNRKCKQGFKCVKTDKIIFYSKLAKAAYSKHAAAYSKQLNLLKVDVHSQDMHKKSRGGDF